jgi:hypothetical protein
MAKEISIDKVKGQLFCMYSLEHNRNAMRKLTKSAYYLYTYFVQNQDGFVLNLYRTHAMKITGLSKTAYYRAFDELVEHGYITENEDGYEFHEKPIDK